MVNDDEILSIEDGWRLYLEERFGHQMTTQEKRSLARHYIRLKLAGPKLEESRESLRRYQQCAGDIVHGWDDPDDFGLSKSAFEVLELVASALRRERAMLSAALLQLCESRRRRRGKSVAKVGWRSSASLLINRKFASVLQLVDQRN